MASLMGSVLVSAPRVDQVLQEAVPAPPAGLGVLATSAVFGCLLIPAAGQAQAEPAANDPVSRCSEVAPGLLETDGITMPEC